MIKKLIAGIFVLSTLVVNAYDKNFVREGDFSSNGKGWRFFARYRAGAFVNEGPNGKKCYKLSGGKNLTQNLYLYNLGTRSGWETALEKGETYTMSFWIKTEKLSGLFKKSPLHLINKGWTRSVVFPVPSTCDWTRIVKTFQAPPQTRKVSLCYTLLIYASTHMKGTFWITDIQIEKGNKASAFTNFWNFPASKYARDYKRIQKRINKTKINLTKKFPNSPIASEINKLDVRLKAIATPAPTNSSYQDAIRKLKEIDYELGRKLCRIWFKNPLSPSLKSDLPTGKALKKMTLYRNQKREFAIMISNFSGENAEFRVAPLNFSSSLKRVKGRSFISLYNAPLLQELRNRQNLHTDPLPRANQIGGITVGSGTTRQIIASINTNGFTPGIYKGIIRVASMTNPEFSRDFKLTFEVLPVELYSSVPTTICGMGSLLLRKREADELGMNSLSMGTGSFTPRLGKDGKLIPLNFDSLQGIIRRTRKTNPAAKFTLDFSIGKRFYRTSKLQWPHPDLVAGWKKFTSLLAAELKKTQLKPNDFLVQVVDEPALSGIKQYIEMQEIAKRNGLKIWTTLTGFDSSNPLMEKFYKQQDYVVLIYDVARNPKASKFFRKNNIPTGIYTCDAWGETLDPTAYYRIMAWMTWKNKFKGWHFWYRDDRNPNWKSIKNMSVVYTQNEGKDISPIWPEDDYVISRRWLGMRAAWQDYRSLYQLKKVADELKSSSADNFLRNATQEALKLASPETYPRSCSGDPDLLYDLNEIAAKLTAKILQKDNFAVTTLPKFNNGKLTVSTNQPCRLEVRTLDAGRLPWKVQYLNRAKNHILQLSKSTSRCDLTMINDRG